MENIRARYLAPRKCAALAGWEIKDLLPNLNMSVSSTDGTKLEPGRGKKSISFYSVGYHEM